ncbi:prepilin peptidase dependent protein B [Cricetibacter osteomyelitidis]|uniref:Prepilin peptidase dependent protein B n=1 Tax=Cricetibacter osteomyelitidis TaxID=1521931 RepID=A0A4R2SLI6_9PAST|nr:type II secretion system protein J [Cricetibacter osteomyelitidis]TCP89765.1 prepilin peptidase dependent protein B [Cricetibacter osteomyelitidis]
MIKAKLFRGQSLLELMISLALSVFLLMTILTFYSHTQQQNHRLLDQLQLQSELHKVLQVMAKDIRRTGFRAKHEKVLNNNLSLFELDAPHKSINIPKPDCVLFFYDLNADGCIGVQKSGVCLNGSQNATKTIESELFGYRLNQQMVETRLTYKNAISQRCEQAECRSYLAEQACTNNGGWTDLLDNSEYEITELKFAWLGEKALEVRIKGRLKNQPNLIYEANTVIPLLNE